MAPRMTHIQLHATCELTVSCVYLCYHDLPPVVSILAKLAFLATLRIISESDEELQLPNAHITRQLDTVSAIFSQV